MLQKWMGKRKKRREPAPDTFSLDGVHVEAFRDFIADCGGEEKFKCGGDGRDGMKTTENVCYDFLKPLTATGQCSYCDKLKEDRASLVGRANVFITHAWKYTFLDVVDVLEESIAEMDRDDIFVWFDLFSWNQHQNEEYGENKNKDADESMKGDNQENGHGNENENDQDQSNLLPLEANTNSHMTDKVSHQENENENENEKGDGDGDGDGCFNENDIEFSNKQLRLSRLKDHLKQIGHTLVVILPGQNEGADKDDGECGNCRRDPEKENEGVKEEALEKAKDEMKEQGIATPDIDMNEIMFSECRFRDSMNKYMLPMVFHRMWCLWELYFSIKAQCLITLTMSSEYKIIFINDLISDNEKSIDRNGRLSDSIDIVTSNCSIQKDRECLLYSILYNKEMIMNMNHSNLESNMKNIMKSVELENRIKVKGAVAVGGQQPGMGTVCSSDSDTDIGSMNIQYINTTICDYLRVLLIDILEEYIAYIHRSIAQNEHTYEGRRYDAKSKYVSCILTLTLP
jgi:hypothetical protein